MAPTLRLLSRLRSGARLGFRLLVPLVRDECFADCALVVAAHAIPSAALFYDVLFLLFSYVTHPLPDEPLAASSSIL